jgi:hypothetical protein
MSIANTLCWPSLRAQPDRYIIQANEGLIQVILERLNGSTKVWDRNAGSAIAFENA